MYIIQLYLYTKHMVVQKKTILQAILFCYAFDIYLMNFNQINVYMYNCNIFSNINLIFLI